MTAETTGQRVRLYHYTCGHARQVRYIVTVPPADLTTWSNTSWQYDPETRGHAGAVRQTRAVVGLAQRGPREARPHLERPAMTLLPDIASEAGVQRIHASVPACGCTGACWEQCQNIAATATEAAILERALRRPLHTRPARQGRVFIANDQRGLCPALDDTGRCSAYAARPLVCRLFGAVESLPCEHGCGPVMPARTGSDLVDRLLSIEATRSGR